MKTRFIAPLIFVCLATASAYGDGFTLTSPDLGGQLTQAQVFSGFGCSGQNKSPALKWSNPPEGTRAFAVTLYDPDAPSGSGWWHWLVFDIPANIHELKSSMGDLELDLAPDGSVQSITDFGTPGFGGACPPEGARSHRYIFTVYALDIEKLGQNENSPPAMVGFFLNQHALAKASIISYYGR